ncbi:MAG: type IV toxin-antitoxin system AbiEi family antitoxin domain-containing protein [Elusimicrobia bacterium]|nr:type IV toxin-antitoxin system AbiEi family antitoxin domain-containing protein [Elusimicrobiota bacterium]
MSTSAAELVELLQKHKLRVISTTDLITLTGMSPWAATHALERMAVRGLLSRIKRGLWANRLVSDFNSYEVVSYLRLPWTTYVSLHSALADYGIVEEVPQIVYGISAALPKRYKTSVGEFHIHHLPERLIWGYETRKSGQGSYLMAEPEKAFLDLAYLALTPRSPLELPRKRGKNWELDIRKLGKYAKRFNYLPLRRWLKENRLWA